MPIHAIKINPSSLAAPTGAGAATSPRSQADDYPHGDGNKLPSKLSISRNGGDGGGWSGHRPIVAIIVGAVADLGGRGLKAGVVVSLPGHAAVKNRPILGFYCNIHQFIRHMCNEVADIKRYIN